MSAAALDAGIRSVLSCCLSRSFNCSIRRSFKRSILLLNSGFIAKRKIKKKKMEINGLNHRNWVTGDNYTCWLPALTVSIIFCNLKQVDSAVHETLPIIS